jgi:uncharacterized protein YcbX
VHAGQARRRRGHLPSHGADDRPPRRDAARGDLASEIARGAGDEKRGHAALRYGDVPAGTVASLHRWPVKSLAGEDADALNLDPRGVAGDRAHALFDVHRGAPRQLTIRQAPGMLHWSATYAGLPGAALAPDAVPLPQLTGPAGARYAWDDPELPGALSADLGREITLRRSLALMQDLGNSILVTTQATLEAVSATLGHTLDLRRFRTNIHVILPDTRAYAEERWEGGVLTVGDVEIQLLHPCVRCVIPTRDPDTATKDPEILRWLTREHGGLFGINGRVRGSGRIAVGDPVALRPA